MIRLSRTIIKFTNAVFLPCIVRRLKENEDEEQLVDDADREGEPPESGMGPKEGSVRHDGHPERDPEEEGGHQTPSAVVFGVVLDGVLYHADVNQTANLNFNGTVGNHLTGTY